MGRRKATKTAWPEDALTGVKEKRGEQRQPADEEVRLFLLGAEPAEVEGRLLDYSNGGFRVAHQHCVLQAGEEVRFRHFRAEGKARVVWNRIVPQQVESGFVILE